MTTTTMAEPSDDRCATCGENHLELAARGVVPKHPFNNGSVSFKATFGDRNPQRDGKTAQRGAEGPGTAAVSNTWPFDPVLRQALVDKGVLTPDDLRAAEDKIRDASLIFGRTMGGDDGEAIQGR